jgi:membrane-associated phospholipid phosphatase
MSSAIRRVPVVLLFLLVASLTTPSLAFADNAAPEADAGVAPAAPVAPVAPPTSVAPAPPAAPAPAPAHPHVAVVDLDQHFTVDPIADGVIIAMGGGTSGMLELILSTGEIKPAPPGPTSNLLSFDRIAVTQTVDPHAATVSTIGLGVAIGYAFLDPLLSGVRDGWDAALVDAMMYAESLTTTLALTDITKIAVRRPRPLAYTEQAALDAAGHCTMTGCNGSITSTDATLSFFSGHASTVGAVTGTATYLAFMRSPKSWRPWVTMALGTLLTAGVSYERVRAGAHFPTDVIAGSLAGACVGVLIPHLHRRAEEHPHIWIGFAPAEGGGKLNLQGQF